MAATSIGSGGVTFPDGTTQATAASLAPATSTSVGAIIAAFPNVGSPTPTAGVYAVSNYATGATISGSSLGYDCYYTYTVFTAGNAYATGSSGGGTLAQTIGWIAAYGENASGYASISPRASGSAGYSSGTVLYYSTGLSGTWRAVTRNTIMSYGNTGKGGNRTSAWWAQSLWQRTA